MSGRFATLKQAAAVKVEPVPAPASMPEAQAGTTKTAKKARDDKKLVGGWFTPELNQALRQIALDERTTVQALIGEAVDLLMRSRDKHPFGER